MPGNGLADAGCAAQRAPAQANTEGKVCLQHIIPARFAAGRGELRQLFLLHLLNGIAPRRPWALSAIPRCAAFRLHRGLSRYTSPAAYGRPPSQDNCPTPACETAACGICCRPSCAMFSCVSCTNSPCRPAGISEWAAGTAPYPGAGRPRCGCLPSTACG